MRSKKIVKKAREECFEKLWYGRHCWLVAEGKFEDSSTPSDIKKGAFERAEKIEDKYPIEELNPKTEFELGLLAGRWSALRWVLDCEWDIIFPDT